MAQQTKRDPDSLYKIPHIDGNLLYLMDYYNKVKGKDLLTYQELESWQRLTGYELSPGEIELLFIIDEAFYSAQHKAQ